jgi:isocitrate dehydrogenase kinase/phosphatase
MSLSRPPTPSRLADPVAREIAAAFAEYREAFLAVTRRARAHFEGRDWRSMRADASLRLSLYRTAVDRAEATTRELLGERCRDRLVWVSAKAVYSSVIAQRQDWDLAETFFNSVTRRLFTTVGVDPLVEYVASDFDQPPSEVLERVYARHAGRVPIAELVDACLRDAPLSVEWIDRSADAAIAAERIERHLAEASLGRPIALEVIRPLFFQGKGAYIVGRLVLPAGNVIPVVLALRNRGHGLFVDAVLIGRSDVSVLFSVTRGYFMVDAERPYDVMRFLRSLMPKKPIAELYIAIGEAKQGKTELYRGLVEHIEDIGEKFCFAPGIPGLVMVVFTAPRLGMVLKVIRDRFPPEKTVSAAMVRERYGWVYGHDRAGRLVDAQEFEHLTFPLDGFEPDLLEELKRECGRSIDIDGDRVSISLAYVERRLTPLNIYVRTHTFEEASAALAEYAKAIRDLALCNIFPGDLLLKNFGLTRNGRVALYDYDELTDLLSVQFRDIPEAKYDEDEHAAEAWFSVGPRDVFPEEFKRFLGLPPELKQALVDRCPEIFSAAWWRTIQDRVRSGKIPEFAPYPAERKLRARGAEERSSDAAAPPARASIASQ